MGGTDTLGQASALSKGPVGSRACRPPPPVGSHPLELHHKVLEQWAQNSSTIHRTPQLGEPGARKFHCLQMDEANFHQVLPLC